MCSVKTKINILNPINTSIVKEKKTRKLPNSNWPLVDLDKINKILRTYKGFMNCGQLPKGKHRTYLLDAVSSGCEDQIIYNYITNKLFKQEVLDDINDILKYYPDSLFCSEGFLFNRSGCTPLVMACFNINLPLSVIKILLEKGASICQPYLCEQKEITIVEDLFNSLFESDRSRWEALYDVFLPYLTDTQKNFLQTKIVFSENKTNEQNVSESHNECNVNNNYSNNDNNTNDNTNNNNNYDNNINNVFVHDADLIKNTQNSLLLATFNTDSFLVLE